METSLPTIIPYLYKDDKKSQNKVPITGHVTATLIPRESLEALKKIAHDGIPVRYLILIK